MTLEITALHHIQVTVPKAAEAAARRFYGELLGLQEFPKPEPLQRRGGMWYRLGDQEVHVSLEDNVSNQSKRHVCYLVTDLDRAEQVLREGGVEIIPDDQPIAAWRRFYVRDPGGNRVELAQWSVVGDQWSERSDD